MPPRGSRLPDPLRELMPLTPAVFFILFALADGEKHGYAIMRQVAELSDSKVRMGPGTLYTTIQRLLELGAIEETARPGQPEGRRRYYRLSGAGRLLLDAEFNRLNAVLRLAGRKKVLPQGAHS